MYKFLQINSLLLGVSVPEKSVRYKGCPLLGGFTVYMFSAARYD